MGLLKGYMFMNIENLMEGSIEGLYVYEYLEPYGRALLKGYMFINIENLMEWVY